MSVGMKRRFAHELERAVLAADPVDALEQRLEARRVLPVPVADLVLLVVAVLLALRVLDRLDVLERRAVEPVGRRHRGREDVADDVGRAPAVGEVVGEDVGRVRPEVRPVVLADLGLEQLGPVLLQFLLRVAPREVGVRVVEAELGEHVHRPRLGERFGEEDEVGVRRAQLADAPLPERERLRVRVVDAEDADALLDPELEHGLQLVPERAPVLGLEVERVDVLVFLRRVLGVADRAVGPVAEPRRVLFHVRVVGRGLERDVERDLQAELVGLRDEALERFHPAELGRDGFVPAVGAADRPWAAGLAGLRRGRIVLALAELRADGVDGREVDDVEAEVVDPREAGGRVVERAVGAGGVGGGAGEELVPRAESGQLGVDADAEPAALDGALGGVAPARELDHGMGEGGVGVAFLEPLRVLHQLLAVVGARGLGGAAEERGAVEEFGVELRLRHAAVDAAAELVLPRPEGVEPRPHLVAVAPEALDAEAGDVLVVVAERHRRRLHGVVVLVPPLEFDGQLLVPVNDGPGHDLDLLADGALDRPLPAVDARGEGGEDDAGPGVGGGRGRSGTFQRGGSVGVRSVHGRGRSGGEGESTGGGGASSGSLFNRAGAERIRWMLRAGGSVMGRFCRYVYRGAGEESPGVSSRCL